MSAVGHGDAFGVPVTYQIAIGEDGFAVRADGEVAMAWGHDGRTGWYQDSAGMTRAAEAPEVAMTRMISSVIRGQWCEAHASAPVRDLRAGDQVDELVVTLDPGDGASVATLVIDAGSCQPRTLTCQRPFGIERWRFADFDAGLPRRIDQVLPGDITIGMHIDRVHHDETEARTLCATPQTRVNWHWNDAAAEEIRVERVPSGFLLIEPRVNGRQPGPFVFDTGAAVSVISRAAADQCGLRAVGQSFSSYTTGSVAATRWRAGQFEIGSLRYDQPWFTEMDMSLLSKVTERPIAGVVGYDLLSRAIVEVHIAAPRIVLHPRERSFDLDWRPLSLYSNRPHLHAHFATPSGGIGEGWFRLDSGAPRLGAIFNTPTVARYGLANAPGMASLKLPLPGGTVDATMGPIAWLELAGRRVENFRGLCVLGRGTGFDDAACAGNVGQDVLADLRLVFDYSSRRAALR
jgi:hypothetical protein